MLENINKQYCTSPPPPPPPVCSSGLPSFVLIAFQGATADLLASEFQDGVHTLRTYAHARIGHHPGAKYAETMKLFKAAKLTDYMFMKTHKHSDDEVRSLSVFPFVDDDMMEGLLNEKEDYFLAASDTDEEYGHMAFWGQHKQKLPKWHAVVMVVVLLQPSSAFMERVFSILRCCFDERQQSVYSDSICASALLKYIGGRAGGSTGLREDRDGPKDGDGWL